MQLIVRAVEPACGRPDFCAWVLGQLASKPAPQAAAFPTPKPPTAPAISPPPMLPPPPASDDGLDEYGVEDGPGGDLLTGMASEAPDGGVAGMQVADDMEPGMGSLAAKITARSQVASPRSNAVSDFGGGNPTLDADLARVGALASASMEERKPARGSDDGVQEVADDAFTPTVNRNNYQRGQRYKRLSRMLTGRVASGRIRWTRNCSIMLIAAVVMVQTACFVVMLILTEQQKAQAMNLTTAGRAATAAARIANLFMQLNFLDQQ